MRALRGLYAVTPTGMADPAALRQAVVEALAGGAAVIQFRDKSGDPARRRRLGESVLEACRSKGAAMIVNDDVDLAVRLDADGVHLGRDDAGPAEARRRLGDRALIGVSCYDDFDRARAACAEGADYVAFGSFFASPTKPLAVRAPLNLLERARVELPVPVVAIGGITPENGRALIDAGADMLAVISGVFAAADVTAAARAYARLFPEDD